MRTLLRLLAALAFTACTAMPAATAPLARGTYLPFTPAAGSAPADRGEVLEQASAEFRYFDVCCTGIEEWWLSGTVESQVVRADDGTLDFYLRVRYDVEWVTRWTDGERAIERMALIDFFDPQFIYEPGVLSGSGAYSPMQASVLDPSVLSEELDAVNVSFTEVAGHPAPAWSDWFFFDTDAVRYRRNASVAVRSALANRAGSRLMPMFGPAPIPEPATWASLGVGLCLLVAVARRKRG